MTQESCRQLPTIWFGPVPEESSIAPGPGLSQGEKPRWVFGTSGASGNRRPGGLAVLFLPPAHDSSSLRLADGCHQREQPAERDLPPADRYGPRRENRMYGGPHLVGRRLLRQNLFPQGRGCGCVCGDYPPDLRQAITFDERLHFPERREGQVIRSAPEESRDPEDANISIDPCSSSVDVGLRQAANDQLDGGRPIEFRFFGPFRPDNGSRNPPGGRAEWTASCRLPLVARKLPDQGIESQRLPLLFARRSAGVACNFDGGNCRSGDSTGSAAAGEGGIAGRAGTTSAVSAADADCPEWAAR